MSRPVQSRGLLTSRGERPHIPGGAFPAAVTTTGTVSLAVLPLFLLLSRKVGKVRRELSGQTQESLADLTAHMQETLSVSGSMLGEQQVTDRATVRALERVTQAAFGQRRKMLRSSLKSVGGEALLEHDGEKVVVSFVQRIVLRGLHGEVSELAAKGGLDVDEARVRKWKEAIGS